MADEMPPTGREAGYFDRVALLEQLLDVVLAQVELACLQDLDHLAG